MKWQNKGETCSIFRTTQRKIKAMCPERYPIKGATWKRCDEWHDGTIPAHVSVWWHWDVTKHSSPSFPSCTPQRLLPVCPTDYSSWQGEEGRSSPDPLSLLSCSCSHGQYIISPFTIVLGNVITERHADFHLTSIMWKCKVQQPSFSFMKSDQLHFHSDWLL